MSSLEPPPGGEQGTQGNTFQRGGPAWNPLPESRSPYDPGLSWEGLYPLGPGPRGRWAWDYQYEANRRAELMRQSLWSDAQGSIDQALGLLSSYRPGGSAALASGLHGQRAGLFATQAQTIEAPDMLIDMRRHLQAEANRKANRAAAIGQALGIAQGVAGIASTGLSLFGGAGAGGAAAAGLTPGGAGVQTYPAGQQPPNVPGMQAGMQPGAPGQNQQAVYDPGQWTPQQQQQFQQGQRAFGQAMQQTYQAPGGAAPMRPPATGSPPAPSGGAGGAPGAVPPPGGGPPGAGPMGGAPPIGGLGGLGQDGNFSSMSVASAGMRGSPGLESVVVPEWAESSERRRSTFLILSAARSRLLRAQVG